MSEAIPNSMSVRPGPALAAAEGRVSARTLITIRWIAVAGQFATLTTVMTLFEFELALAHALAGVGVSVLVNLYAARRVAAHPFLEIGRAHV